MIDYCLDLVNSRKHLFADILQQANDLLDTHFFPQNADIHSTNINRADCLEAADWDDVSNTLVYKTI
jgi:hypothetical protein